MLFSLTFMCNLELPGLYKGCVLSQTFLLFPWKLQMAKSQKQLLTFVIKVDSVFLGIKCHTEEQH